MKKALTLLILLISLSSHAQLTQTITGVVVDRITQTTLPGATITLQNSDPLIGASTDINGRFQLENVPVGRQSLSVQFIGYETIYINNLIVNSAKQVNLTIELNEKIENLKTVTITADNNKEKASNEMALISARGFTVEETDKYAGSRGDVARMAMNYAGVSGANDQRNDIVIRGNSPSGLLWRLDGIDIGNPSHFAQQGTTGGPVGMLNNNTLRNSDFFTGAFPAEYGNALSGVFDLKMKSGNKTNYEFLGQIGFNGFEFGAEGPISKKKLSSFIANYRYSTLGLMGDLGVDFGTGGGVPYYQDLNYNIELPTKKGKINIIGLYGTSHISILGEEAGEDNIFSASAQDLFNGSDLAFTTVNYSRQLGKNTLMKQAVSYLYQNGWTNIDTISPQGNKKRFFEENSKDERLSYRFSLHHKLNAKFSSKEGITVDRLGFNLNSKVADESGELQNIFSSKRELTDGEWLVRAYNQWALRSSGNFQMTPGIHLLYFSQTNEVSVEPRLGMEYTVSPEGRIIAGYGHHGRIQNLSAYFVETRDGLGNVSYTNENLGMSKAHHAIIGYDHQLAKNTRVKLESYYQYLYNIPVETSSSFFSMINSGSSFGVTSTDSLVNNGTGRNLGLEVTLEKFYSKGYYYLFTASLFDSKYKGSDGKERSTAFNGGFVYNALVGKEFELKDQSTVFFDLKGTFAGGNPYVPVDETQSRLTAQNINETVYDFDRAFEQNFSDYLKIDVKVGYRQNKKKVSQEWMVYIENVTNHKNVLQQYWDPENQAVKTVYQLGLFPMMQYRIYF